jgi:hypothetical protein
LHRSSDILTHRYASPQAIARQILDLTDQFGRHGFELSDEGPGVVDRAALGEVFEVRGQCAGRRGKRRQQPEQLVRGPAQPRRILLAVCFTDRGETGR